MIALACVEPIAGKSERMKTHIKRWKNLSNDEHTLALLTAHKSASCLPSQNPITLLIHNVPNPPLLSSPQILAETTAPLSAGSKCQAPNQAITVLAWFTGNRRCEVVGENSVTIRSSRRVLG
jgi:hypothetical protein